MTWPVSLAGAAVESMPQGDYAWNLWRPYSCCRDRGIFLFNVDWINYPP
jgi:hypothetical protein